MGPLDVDEPREDTAEVWLRALSDAEFDALAARWFGEHGEERQDMQP